MSRSLRTASLGLLIVAMLGALIHVGMSRSEAQAPSTSAAKGWDYRTEEVDLAILQATLVTLGRDGWDVAEVLHVNQTVGNDADGQAHLRAGRVMIVAKRPLEK